MPTVPRDPPSSTRSEEAADREMDAYWFATLRKNLQEMLVTIRDLSGMATDPEDCAEAEEMLERADHTFADANEELARVEAALDYARGRRKSRRAA